VKDLHILKLSTLLQYKFPADLDAVGNIRRYLWFFWGFPAELLANRDSAGTAADFPAVFHMAFPVNFPAVCLFFFNL